MNTKKEILLTSLCVIVITASLFLGWQSPTKIEQSRTLQFNNNKKLAEKHCFHSLCTENMVMTFQAGTGTIEFTLKNEGSEKVAASFLKVISKEDEQINYIFYYDETLPGATQLVKITCDTDTIINIKDYELTTLSSAESVEATTLLNKKTNS